VVIVFSAQLSVVHCKQDPIYVFPEMKLRGLVPTIGPPILQQQSTDRGNI
jgi:hypothetical protein